MINYAHRGASEYAPENTLSSFYLGLLQGANGIETDVRKTKDGIPVLFHDDTLDRVTNATGKVCDYTLAELKKVKVFGNSTNGFFDRIVTFREFLEKFSQYDINFAIELKGENVERETLELVKEFGIIKKTTFTSFEFDYIQKIKELDSSARIGWLISEITEDILDKMRKINGEEIAPEAEFLTEELVKTVKNLGFGVRAWGVGNVKVMKDMCKFGVDGMTVNFPDRLREYLNSL